MERFAIEVVWKRGWKPRRYTVQRWPRNDQQEWFAINGRNGRVLLCSNGPYFRSSGRGHKMPDFSVVEWLFTDYRMVQALFDAIWQATKPPEL